MGSSNPTTEKCSHGVPMAFLYCRECSIVWHEEGERWAKERLYHHQRCLASLRGETIVASGLLSHDDYCRLSRLFNEHAALDGGQDYRINEWLKGQIAAALT